MSLVIIVTLGRIVILVLLVDKFSIDTPEAKALRVLILVFIVGCGPTFLMLLLVSHFLNHS